MSTIYDPLSPQLSQPQAAPTVRAKTLAEFKLKNFAALEPIQPQDMRDKQRQALLYIEQMAALTQTDIAGWDLLDVFGSPDNPGMFVTDKRTINKRLHARSSLVAQGVPFELGADHKKLIDAANKSFQRRIKEQIEYLTQNVQTCHTQAASYYANYQSKLSSAWKYQQDLRALQERGPVAMADEVTKICQDPFWKWEGLTDGRVATFSNRAPVVMTYRNKAAGIDMQVSMGFYKVSLDFESLSIWVSPHKDNLFSRGGNSGHYHTYISDDGNICWGNGSNQASKYLTEGQFHSLMQLLQGVLTQYAPDSTPYCDLWHFFYEQQRKLGVTNPAAVPEENLCETCEELEDDCNCWTCESCEGRYREDEGCDNCTECEACGIRYASGNGCPNDCFYCDGCDNTIRGGETCENCITCEVSGSPRRERRGPCSSCREGCPLYVAPTAPTNGDSF